ncbi:MAG: family 2 glycosyl transferase [Limisphaerales bacterium]|nr:MAG: family 2 glycosyl transferase [Limisphaerales bacterium]KAG0508150.1 MAG: family 2 glycosyl transferase [Limisphaerales bacterium]TXT52997.1 MAG: family 2 glycosyl transferase [Limisphaerales bacterium]
MDLADITPLVLTYNEEVNLARCLARLAWAREVVVVDSRSTDGTKAAASRHGNVRFLERPFDHHTAQWNFGVDQITTDWVLALDADYILEAGFEQELAALQPAAELAACAASFRYCINGRPLRGTLYPPRLVLFRRAKCRYEQDGHTQLLRAGGPVAALRTRILHDDRKPLSHWVWSQDRYARLEAEKLAATPGARLGFNDRLRRTIVLGPPAVLLYTLFARGVILDGWAGWYYALQRTLAETLLSLRLIEAKWAASGTKAPMPKPTNDAG